MIDEIQAAGSNYRAGQVSRTKPAGGTPARPVPSPQITADRVEISELAFWRAKIGEIPEVRAEKIAEVRAQLEANNYESDEKLDDAVERLLNDPLSGL